MTARLRLTLALALRRLASQRNLMLCFLAGLAAAVALLSSLPMYSDAVNKRLLSSQLETGSALPPFAFVWRYIGAFNGDIGLDEYAPVDDYFTAEAAAVIGLPLDEQVRHLRSLRVELWADPAEQLYVSDAPLLGTTFGVLTGLDRHVQLVQGVFPADDASDAIPVLISQSLAERTGIQSDERYQVRVGDQALSIQIAGIWRPLNPADGYWFYRPDVFDDMLLVTEPAFVERVAPVFSHPLAQAVWYQVYDGTRFQPNGVPALLESVRRVEAQSSGLLPGVTLDASPVGALETYGQQARTLTLLLTVFAIPILGLILYFVALMARLIVERGEHEIAIWRSRGAARWQILVIYLLEGAVISVMGLLIGLWLGRELATLMTRTERFLVLQESSAALPAVISSAAWQYGLAGVGLGLAALLLPALSSTRHTILSFRREQSRSLRQPFWRRYFLDLLLVLPPVYGLYLLQRQGAFGAGDQVFDNPLLFLVPALFCLALSLVFIRLFPYLIAGLARLAERYWGVAALLTLRQLARSTAHYTGPLLLICLTLSLATFTASMAHTLDEHLVDQVYYSVGADLSLAEIGEPIAAEGGDDLGFAFLPVDEHLAVGGVLAAARVGDYAATASIGGRQTSGRLLGIDRLDLPGVTFFRADFAREPLIGLLNRLAVRRSGLLVSQSFLDQRSLGIGDALPLTVNAGEKFVQIPFTIVGSFDLFPTYYPADGPLFVAHLDYVFERLDGAYPYGVWLATAPTADGERIVSALRQRGFTIVTAQDARARLAEAQAQPERQGLFGLLSAGFFAAALLTVLGYLVFEVVGFQRRFVALGMLRALGLSTGQLVGHLAGEQAALTVTGMSAGTLIGVLASRLFIPFLQAGSGREALVPPFVVQIAWGQLLLIYAIFGLMLIVAVLVLAVFLTRMKVFEAVKLGETV
jgi:putative ABC transport system permease protein